jgi:hypothetical protein
MPGRKTWDYKPEPEAPYSLEEAIRLRREGWYWSKLAKRYAVSCGWLEEHVAPHVHGRFLHGLTEAMVRAYYVAYEEFPNITALSEKTGVGRHMLIRSFELLGLPRLKATRRSSAKYTVVGGPKCRRCGILLEETRHRGDACVECLLEEAGRKDLALDNRGYFFDQGDIAHHVRNQGRRAPRPDWRGLRAS